MYKLLNLKRHFLASFIGLNLLSAAAPAQDSQPSPSNIIDTQLNIRKFPTANLTDAQSATIIGEANTYLAQCRVQLSQVGTVMDASNAPSVINSQADLSQACASANKSLTGPNTKGILRRYRVVNAINWCGGPASGGTILGCTGTPGTCIVMRRWSTLEGQVLAHEFGHSKGLPHRNDADAVMYPSIAANHKVFTQGECNALRQLALTSHGIPRAMAVEIAPGSIEDFVSQVYPDGLPYEVAAKYQPSDVARISPWLKDETKAQFWSNVAATVGIIASPDAYATLTELIERQATGKLPVEQYEGRVAAVMALGFVVKNSNSQMARSFLEKHTLPSAWSTVRWMAPYQETQAERDNDLAAVAALGLARAGDSPAINFLGSRLKSIGSAKNKGAVSLKRAIQQALTDAKKMNKFGSK